MSYFSERKSSNERGFATTQWQVVSSAGRGAQPALAELCQTYWKPLYAYVRRMGYSPHDAQDLTQSFIVHALQGSLLSSADPGKGKFRTFLLTSLRRFAVNQWKRDTAAKRGGKHTVLRMDFDDAESTLNTTPWHNLTPDRVYERSLAIELLKRSVASLQEEVEKQGKKELFQVLLPNLGRSDDALPYRELEHTTGMTADALKMTVSRWRKSLREHVRQSLRHAGSSEEDVDADVARLFAAF